MTPCCGSLSELHDRTEMINRDMGKLHIMCQGWDEDENTYDIVIINANAMASSTNSYWLHSQNNNFETLLQISVMVNPGICFSATQGRLRIRVTHSTIRCKTAWIKGILDSKVNSADLSLIPSNRLVLITSKISINLTSKIWYLVNRQLQYGKPICYYKKEAPNTLQ